MSTSSFPLESRPPPRKRQRARKACLPCHQRKRKCDNEYPCAPCTTYGYTCQYTPEGGPTAQFVDSQNAVRHSPTTAERRIAPPSDVAKSSPKAELSGSAGSPLTAERGILDPAKTRYTGLHSAVAFPRNLGLEFQSADPPRVHSFAWNCGVRLEENSMLHADLRTLVSQDDFDRYSKVFFNTVHPIFGILDESQFLRSGRQFCSEATPLSAFEAVVSGVVALGSFFSGAFGHPQEAEIVQHAKGILDDPIFGRRVTVDQVSAWILRTLYLRLTTRPHVSWLASSITIHLAEATGLHHEIDSVILADATSKAVSLNQDGYERTRRLFWCARLINDLISYEYARSPVKLSSVTCQLPTKQYDGDFLLHLIAIAQLVPEESCHSPRPELHQTLIKLDEIPDDHSFVSLSKADLCLCLYRHHRLSKLAIEKEDVLHIIRIGNRASEAAKTLAEENRYWWSILGTVFQYICVLLALDTTESLRNVSGAMATLETIASLLGTHIADEALNTAKLLLRDSMKKKRRDASLLEAADTGDNLERSVSSVEIDWDALLDPSFMSTFMPMQQGSVLFQNS
jgi:hypothetical protein